MNRFKRKDYFFLVVLLLPLFWSLWHWLNEPSHCEKLLQQSVIYVNDNGKIRDSALMCSYEKAGEFWRHQRKVVADLIDPVFIQERLDWFADQEKLVVEIPEKYRRLIAENRRVRELAIRELERTNPFAAKVMRDQMYLEEKEEALKREREALSRMRSREYFLADIENKRRLLGHIDSQIHQLENGRPLLKPLSNPDGTRPFAKPIPRP